MAWTVSGNIFTDAIQLLNSTVSPDHLFALAQNADPATMQAEVSTGIRRALGPGATEAQIQQATAEAMGQVATTYNEAIAANPLWTDSVYKPDFASASGDPNAAPWNPLWVIGGIAAVGVAAIGVGMVAK